MDIRSQVAFFGSQSQEQDDTVASAKTSSEQMSAKKAPGAFLTISEVADKLDIQQHVLRFWETKFTQLKPLKRGGGRRYYRPEDVALVKVIHNLLYTDKYTIKGAQKLLKGFSKMQVIQKFTSNENVPQAAPVSNDVNTTPVHRAQPMQGQEAAKAEQKAMLEGMVQDLKELRSIIANS